MFQHTHRATTARHKTSLRFNPAGKKCRNKKNKLKIPRGGK